MKIWRAIRKSGAIFLIYAVFSQTVFSATFTVDTFTDDLHGSCELGNCTLRDALSAASVPGADTITFSSGTHTIDLASAINISDPGHAETTIQAPDTTHGIIIESDPSGLPGALPTITIGVSGVILDGLVISGGSFSDRAAINITGGSATLKNNYIDATGDLSGHAGDVRAITIASDDNNIGTGVEGEGNNIGGQIYISSGTNNNIAGNYIGVSETGEDISPESPGPSKMIEIAGSEEIDVTFGGSDAAHRNVMGNWGNGGDGMNGGMWIENPNPSTEVNIYGNYIGVKSDGSTSAPNSSGISIVNGFGGTVNIGSSEAGTGNVISGNSNTGVGGQGALSPLADATINIQNNFIGTDSSGLSAVGNTGCGVMLASGNGGAINIGPTRNVIGGNACGIYIADYNEAPVTITGNYVGLGADGETVMANEGNGVLLAGSGEITVGGESEEARNVISGNDNGGIFITSGMSGTTTILNNYIGLNADGDTAIPNSISGIYSYSPVSILDNIISGNVYESVEEDEESGNGGNGIELISGADGSEIYNNRIGTDYSGTVGIGNTGYGIYLAGTVSGVLIGDVGGNGNLIYGNEIGGVGMDGQSSAILKSNQISYNDGDGGILIEDGASAIIGGSRFLEDGNVITENSMAGIAIRSSGEVRVRGNVINGNNEGCSDFGCDGSGISIIDVDEGIGDVIIGGEEDEYANMIVSNEYNGIYIRHIESEYDGEEIVGGGISGLQILGNYIGTTPDGDDLGNGTLTGDGVDYPGLVRSGIAVYDMGNNGLITNLIIGSENGQNIIKYNGYNGIYTRFLQSGLINSNVISDHGGDGGVVLDGSSPTITNNLIANNRLAGINGGVDYGDDLTPVGYEDDILSEPTIIGNTFSNNGLIEGSDYQADIDFADSVPDNFATLYQDNTFLGGADYAILYTWAIAVEVLDSLYNPVTEGVSITMDILLSDAEEDYIGSLNSHSGGVWGPEGFDYDDVTTWGLVWHLIGMDGSVVYENNPSTITATVTNPAGVYTGTYVFNGQPHTETGYGLPIDRGGGYQIAEVIILGDEEENDDGGGNFLFVGNVGGGNNGNNNTNDSQPDPEINEIEQQIQIEEQAEDIEEAINTVTETVTVNMETVVNKAQEVVNNKVTVTAPVVQTSIVTASETTSETTTSSESTEPTFEPPTSRESVNSSHVYESRTYQQAALSLILDDEEECGGEKSEKCFEEVYGLTEIAEEQEKPLTEREVGDAVVFNKKPGEVIEKPRIVNLRGTVGSNPAILVLSKANDHVVVELTKEPEKKKTSSPIIKIVGETDEEGKAVLNVPRPLSSGKYFADTYAVRNETKIDGGKTNFVVEGKIDNEFYVTDLKVTEENVHERIEGEAGRTVGFLLTYLEKFIPKFIATNYVEYARTGGKTNIATGRVVNPDQTNKIVYLTYKSVVFGSAVISDASQNGTFRARIARELAADTHDLTAYAHDPKKAKSTSLRTMKFVKR